MTELSQDVVRLIRSFNEPKTFVVGEGECIHNASFDSRRYNFEKEKVAVGCWGEDKFFMILAIGIPSSSKWHEDVKAVKVLIPALLVGIVVDVSRHMSATCENVTKTTRTFPDGDMLVTFVTVAGFCPNNSYFCITLDPAKVQKEHWTYIERIAFRIYRDSDS